MDYSLGHSWISFQVDLKAAAPQFWLLLGEAQARCSQISGAPLGPEAAREIGRIQKARLLLAGAAIAGNTLTDDDVHRHLDGRLDAAPARRPPPPVFASLGAGTAHILEAVVRGAPAEVTPELLLDLNEFALAGAAAITGAAAGALRRDDGPSVPAAADPGPPAREVPDLLVRLCTWLGAPRPGPPLVIAIMKAFLAHLYVSWIRPFADGNGRTARLVELHVLAHAGVPEPALGLAAAHQGRDREEYFRQIERAKHSPSGPTNFLLYATQGFVDELRALQEALVAQQREAAWRDHMAAVLGERGGKTARRQRRLLCDLTAAVSAVPTSRLHALGADTALAYSGLNEKTLRRDLAALLACGLVERVEGGWRARRAAVEAWRASPSSHLQS